MKKLLLPFFLLGFIFIACKKNKEKEIIPDPPPVDISGFKLRDALGNDLGWSGSSYGDWGMWSVRDLSTEEIAYLNFPDNLTLTDPITNLNLAELVAYPNPFINTITVQTKFNQPIKLKIAVVDSMGTVIKTHSQITYAGVQPVTLDFSDITANRRNFRIYYRIDAKDFNYLIVGRGDVKLCRGAAVSNCFD